MDGDDDSEAETLPYPGMHVEVAGSQKEQDKPHHKSGGTGTTDHLESPRSSRQRAFDEMEDRLAEAEMFGAPSPVKQHIKSTFLSSTVASSSVQLPMGCHIQADSTSRMNKNSSFVPMRGPDSDDQSEAEAWANARLVAATVAEGKKLLGKPFKRVAITSSPELALETCSPNSDQVFEALQCDHLVEQDRFERTDTSSLEAKTDSAEASPGPLLKRRRLNANNKND